MYIIRVYSQFQPMLWKWVVKLTRRDKKRQGEGSISSRITKGGNLCVFPLLNANNIGQTPFKQELQMVEIFKVKGIQVKNII